MFWFSKNFLPELTDKIHEIPTLDDIEEYMTGALAIDWKCIGLNQWTSWTNSYELDEDGNDYEFLENHQ